MERSGRTYSKFCFIYSGHAHGPGDDLAADPGPAPVGPADLGPDPAAADPVPVGATSPAATQNPAVAAAGDLAPRAALHSGLKNFSILL